MSAETRELLRYRLTAEDERTITAAMRERVRTWEGPRERGVDRDALVRIGASSIGCGLVDLRECEVDWLYGRADRTLDEACPNCGRSGKYGGRVVWCGCSGWRDDG